MSDPTNPAPKSEVEQVDLDELERQANEGELCITQQLALIAEAREGRRLKSAVAYLAEREDLLDQVPEGIKPGVDGMLEAARSIGWKEGS